MRHKRVTLILLSLIFLGAIWPEISVASNHSPQAIITELTYAGNTFPQTENTGILITDAGLTLADNVNTAVYLSPILTAPATFNVVIPQWIADIPDGTSMGIMLRTAKTPENWSEWFEIEAQPDWMLPGEPDTVGAMIAVPAADVTHQYIQVMISFGRYTDMPAPVLQQLRLTFIDATAGPTEEELLAQQQALDATNPAAETETAYPRPTVISRQVWCIYDDCNYTTGLEYEPVTHMIIHHTVSSNDSSDWAAVVRAIWNFHTYTRGWGDIGYNYLVDLNGVIYEGHNSEDYLNLDVVGTHAAIANAGGMGVALIGTFTTPEEYSVSGTPSQAMLDATADLLAWKASQRNIDVYDAARMVNTSWGLPQLMGHRDVYGGTATLCPGGNAYNLLPWLRDAVASRLNYVSPYIYVDELSGNFTKSNSTWHEGPRGCGNNGHSYYTWSTTDPAQSTNWGEWRPNVPENGRYLIEVYAPYCDTGAPETDGATYEIQHANGTSTVVVSHNNNVGLWMPLGEFDLQAGQNTVIRLTDLTATDSGRGVWFDAVRLKMVPPQATNSLPTTNAWVNDLNVSFSWNILNPSGVQTTTLQVATDAAFTNPVWTTSWGTAVTNTTHTFTQEYPDLYWRVILTPTLGNTVSSPTTRFGLDTTPPTTTITSLQHKLANNTYELTWQGSDALSGLASYSIEYRPDNDINWTPWLTDTTATSAIFTPPDPKQTYWFRVQGKDIAGNIEPSHAGNGDINTTQATPVFNPAVTGNTPKPGWLSSPTVTFRWTITDVTAVFTSTLQIATDPSFSTPILTQTIPAPQLTYTHTFTQEYTTLYWQTTITMEPPTPGLTDTIKTTILSFGLDYTPPDANISTIYTLATDSYLIQWQGSDNTSGIATYTIEYRAVGETTWTPLLTNTTITHTQFTAPTPGQTYEFRAYATDAAGNQETPPNTADLNTNQAIPLPHAIMLPVIIR
ncbi:MAG: hypothetical protein D6706_01760 [Chloroflexi bacterium]|nr:MAG: hypothetical protein D6706_01760 [Chloroflexota bacterium]